MNELYHYGVKGMKWGVRKSVYKSANRKRRKQIRTNFYKKNPGYRVARNTAIGMILGGPSIGVVSGVVTAKKWNYSPYVTAARMRKNILKL